MHKSQYKWDATIKLIITKRTISRKKKVVETINKSTKTETKLEKERDREREREYWLFYLFFIFFIFGHGKLGRNRGERWKWSKIKFIWKLRWKRKSGSRLKVEQSKTIEFKKI